MKLLGWMNFKLKQKGNEPANDVISAHKEVKSNGEGMNFQQKPYDEIFPGFFAIGTLGYNQTINTDPPTPTFPNPFEDCETDITEKELKFINDELDKFLEEKVNEVDYDMSERISHGIINSLSDKHIETGPTERYCSNMEEFPLQKYLLGSSVELPELDAEVLQQKGFLEELFKKKNIVEEDHDGEEKKQSKKKHAGQFMKKILRNLQSKSKNSTTSSKGNATETVSSKKKLSQVLKMFKRKIHPEGMNGNKLQHYETSNISCKTGNLEANSKVNKKFTPNDELNVLDVSSRVTVNKGQWINTDADYLVLEL